MPMTKLADLMKCTGLAGKSSPADARMLQTAVGRLSGLEVYPSSVTGVDGAVLAMAREGAGKRLVVVAGKGNQVLGRFAGQDRQADCNGAAVTVRICATDAASAAALRQVLPFTAPTIIGLATSVGMGDRLGLATPGHLKAIEGTGLMPFVAQQSIREMTRTQRTAQQVMDDATFGVFQAGWCGGVRQRRRPPQDDRGHRLVRSGWLYHVHDRPERARRQRGGKGRHRHAAGQVRQAALGRYGQDDALLPQRLPDGPVRHRGPGGLADQGRGAAAGGVQVRPGDRTHGETLRGTWTRSRARATTRSRCRWTRRTRRPRRWSTSSWPTN